MREIKFRVWIPSAEFMGVAWELQAQLRQMVEIRGKFDEGAVFMQYTGLTDKNGREIYEGDVVRDNQISPSFHNTFVVESLEGVCNIYRDQQDQEDNVFEVIGNAYENPELLEGK